MKPRKHSLFGAFLLFLSFGAAASDTLTVASPSGKLSVEFFLTRDGQPAYRASSRGRELIHESHLGFTLDKAAALEKGFFVRDSALSSFDNIWEQPWGEQHFIRNHYRQLKVQLQEDGGEQRQLNLVFRVFDDGLAFRYEFPQQPKLQQFAVTDELTEFNLAGDYSAWWTPAQAGNQYEYLYRNTPLSKIPLAHTPLTMKTDSGLYLSLHEAALHDYSTMNIAAGEDGHLKAELVPWSKETDVRAKLHTPAVTPWRSLQVADSAAGLINSYLTLNLNEPNKLGDVSWVKPGKYVGIWWELHLEKGTWHSGPKHGATTANTKKYIDFAAANGFDGVLVEGWNQGWDGEWWNGGGDKFNFTKAYPDYDVEELSRYAAKKGVYIIGHHETGAAVDNYERQLEGAFDFLEQHGMKAVKTGYVETGEQLLNGNYHHGQSFVRHQQKVIDTAARHHVMVVAHETVKDTGERRTYPNMISREVARGQEYNAWSEDGGNPPNHTAIMPFTRLLSGPMDFTPGIFDLTLPSRPNNRVNTTLAKQLALYVVIYSPVQMAADLPENYAKYPDAFQFIKDVPTDWESTRALDGEIGEYVSIARRERGGDDWFVGALTNEKARDLDINLDFLDRDLTYTATLYRDGDKADYRSNPESYAIETRTVKAGDRIAAHLAAGGGLAISLMANKPE